MTWPTIKGQRFGSWIYQGTEHASKRRGWKLHITARPGSRAVTIISNVARRNKVTVRFLPSRDDFNALQGSDRGKWCAIYSTSLSQAFSIAAEVSRKLRRSYVKRMKASERPPRSFYVFKYVCVRYGTFDGHTLIKNHNKVTDSCKTVSCGEFWIDNPSVNSEFKSVPDSRQKTSSSAA